MQKLEESKSIGTRASVAVLPVSVIVPVRNEARNLPFCLESLRNVGEVYVVDSQSTDATGEIARSLGAHVVQFHYKGAGPRSASGRWILCRWLTTGFFWWMATKS